MRSWANRAFDASSNYGRDRADIADGLRPDDQRASKAVAATARLHCVAEQVLFIIGVV